MAQSGNGVDIGAVYSLLTEVAESIRGHNVRLENVETKLNELVVVVNDHTRKFDEIAALLNQHGLNFADLSQGLTDLRDAVGQYHYSVIGQGIALNHLAERVSLLEAHLGLGTQR